MSTRRACQPRRLCAEHSRGRARCDAALSKLRPGPAPRGAMQQQQAPAAAARARAARSFGFAAAEPREQPGAVRTHVDACFGLACMASRPVWDPRRVVCRAASIACCLIHLRTSGCSSGALVKRNLTEIICVAAPCSAAISCSACVTKQHDRCINDRQHLLHVTAGCCTQTGNSWRPALTEGATPSKQQCTPHVSSKLGPAHGQRHGPTAPPAHAHAHSSTSMRKNAKADAHRLTPAQ